MRKRLKYLFIFSICLILVGCEKDMNADQARMETIKTDLGILPKLISLPRQPVNVIWEVDEKAGMDNGTLVALLNYTDEDYAYIVNNSLKYESNSNDRMNAQFYKKWVPEELQKTIKIEKQGENYELIGIKQLKPELFTQTDLSPYKNGSITPLGRGYILVSLYAM